MSPSSSRSTSPSSDEDSLPQPTGKTIVARDLGTVSAGSVSGARPAANAAEASGADVAEETSRAGRDWLTEGQKQEKAGNFDGAVRAYDAAIDALAAASSGGSAQPSRAVGVAWMNRGNALQKRADASALDDSVASYRRAIACLERSLLEPGAQVTLGCAWMNLGVALRKQMRSAEAIDACERAVAILSALPAENAHVGRMTAAAWLNLGSALQTVEKPDAARAVSCARSAVAAVEPWEKTDATAADVSLKARQLLCEALVRTLAFPAATRDTGCASDRTAVLAEATDAAEGAMEFIRAWEGRGATGFELTVHWFFRFAAALYAEFQPQFLAEFLLENLDSSRLPPEAGSRASRTALAAEAVAHARLRLHAIVFSDPSAKENERDLETLRSFDAVDRRIAELSAR